MSLENNHPIDPTSSEDFSFKDSDSLSVYLESIKDASIYSREEEQQMFQQYNAGIATVNAILTHELFPKNPSLFISALKTSLDNTIQSFNSIVFHNSKLVVSIANKSQSPDSLQDKIQNGNIGLIKAIEQFDPTLGIKLSSYATFKIKSEIGAKSKDLYSEIRVPRHKIEKGSQLKRYQDTFYLTHSRWPSEEECMIALGWKRNTLDNVKDSVVINSKIISLDVPLQDEINGSTFGDTIADPSLSSPHSIEANLYGPVDNPKLETLTRALERIRCSSDFESKWVDMYLDFFSDNELTIEEIAVKFSLTPAETIKYLSRINNRLHLLIGTPRKNLYNLGAKHQLNSSISFSNQTQKPGVNPDLLEDIADTIHNGSRKIEIYKQYCDDADATLEDVGKQHGLSRERIRQIVSEVYLTAQNMGD